MKFLIPVIIQQIWNGDKSTALTEDSWGVFWCIFRVFFFMLASHSNWEQACVEDLRWSQLSTYFCLSIEGERQNCCCAAFFLLVQKTPFFHLIQSAGFMNGEIWEPLQVWLDPSLACYNATQRGNHLQESSILIFSCQVLLLWNEPSKNSQSMLPCRYSI